jgi:Asp-tRNA(Asn)/Glu-tRNA(Gln) amidotransferase A subunit family amidase
VVAVLAPAVGGSGQQTQLWRHASDGWQITAAHVSGPAPAIDGRVWRIVGTPLVQPTSSGPLDGETVAVKDLFAIQGHRIGGGVPEYLTAARASHVTAAAVSSLLAAGAAITGIARTDEFAYSIAGANPHYGTPPNAAVPGALPGGSSSGPATAVASGQVSIGLATDTAGSIRVPASYQGLWGLRPTHGAVSTDGVLPLAPSFDTVGWLTRTGSLLERVVSAQLAATIDVPRERITSRALLAGLDGQTSAAFASGLERMVADGRLERPADVDLPDPATMHEAFRAVQAAEAWREHGAFLTAHPDAVSGAVRERFRAAASISRSDEQRARDAILGFREELETALAGAVLILPAAASVAPQTTAAADEVDRVRTATLRLTCIAGVLGAPSVAAPAFSVAWAPLGVALVGPRGSDAHLVSAARTLVDDRA